MTAPLIWTQHDSDRGCRSWQAQTESCLFCHSPMLVLASPPRGSYSDDPAVRVCRYCGWWNCFKTQHEYKSCTIYGSYSATTTFGACAVLQNFSLTDQSAPIDEIRRFLIARYDARNDVHPRLLEEVVGAVYRDLDHRVRVTAYSNDGGIDVILDGPGDAMVGVQVKRYANTIGVSSIREFVGSLVLGGFTRGIFVTTSDFTQGAKRAVEAPSRAVPIELVDATGLYDALKISQRPMYLSIEEWSGAVGNVRYQRLESTGPVYEP